MSDPARLVYSSDTTELGKRLLSSWDERPSADAAAELHAMLGISTLKARTFEHVCGKAPESKE